MVRRWCRPHWQDFGRTRFCLATHKWRIAVNIGFGNKHHVWWPKIAEVQKCRSASQRFEKYLTCSRNVHTKSAEKSWLFCDLIPLISCFTGLIAPKFMSRVIKQFVWPELISAEVVKWQRIAFQLKPTAMILWRRPQSFSLIQHPELVNFPVITH